VGNSSGNAHVDFKVVDRQFYNGSDLVKGYPMFGAALDAGKHLKIYIFIGISGAPFWAVMQGPLQSQIHCPLTICTLGKIH